MHPARFVPAVALSLTAAALCLAPAWPAAAQWEAELADQIEAEQACRVAFINEVVRREVEGRVVTMAKVHCEDERSFDARRDDEGEPFEFRECEALNVETC